MALPRNSILQLHDAIAAVAPIDGVAGDANGPAAACTIHFQPAATAQQRADAAAVLAGFDFSQAAEDTREKTRLRTAAQAAFDGIDETRAIIRAAVIEMNARANRQATDFNTLLAWLGTQTTLVNRAQLTALQQGTATPAQAIAAIKARLANGEGT